MNIFSEVLIVDGLFISIIIFVVVYYYAIKTHNHFKNRGIKYLKPLPFFGNTIDITLGRKNISVCFTELYKQLHGERYGGIFMNRSPSLMVRDPDLIQKVLIKDFQHFFDRGTTVDEDLDPLSANLLNLEGQRWKLLRHKLAPAFTLGKLKMMTQQFNECGDELINYLQESVQRDKPIDIRETMAKFSTDVIGSCAFGLQFNSLKDSQSEFRKIGREIFKPTLRLRIRILLRIVHDRLPFLLRVKMFKKDVEDFFINLIKSTIDLREREKIERNDFIQILMNLKKEDSKQKPGSAINNGSDLSFDHVNKSDNLHESENYDAKEGVNQIELDEKLLAANTFIFFVAGFETTASTLSFCMLELAINEDIQIRLRNEIIAACNKYDNEITQDTIKEMTYMDLVISETLRKYPIAGSLIRKCTIPYKIPGTSTYIKKNERVLIPVYPIHHDPKYYPEPEKFDPERFNEENKAKRPNGTFLPFGDGPRICIGVRFALVEIKIALTKILSKYLVKLNSETQLPLTWQPRRILLVPDQRILLNLVPINPSE